MAHPRQDQDQGDGIQDKLVDIRRVAKTVKGGRNMRFAALVVAGDGRGRVGFGTGKAREVPEAIRKASEMAKKNLVRVPLRNGKTLHHDVRGVFGAAKVVFRSAPAGTGIIAGGPIRSVFEVLGIQDVVAKSLGTSNPNNMVQATFEAFKIFESPRHVAARRSMKVVDIIGKDKANDDESPQNSNQKDVSGEDATQESPESSKEAKKTEES